MSCWIRLGLEPTQDLNLIRQAYRGLLPAHHPETDPQGFQGNGTPATKRIDHHRARLRFPTQSFMRGLRQGASGFQVILVRGVVPVSKIGDEMQQPTL